MSHKYKNNSASDYMNSKIILNGKTHLFLLSSRRPIQFSNQSVLLAPVIFANKFVMEEQILDACK